jgi:hypothetical protein
MVPHLTTARTGPLVAQLAASLELERAAPVETEELIAASV